jgi:hypothetical protein
MVSLQQAEQRGGRLVMKTVLLVSLVLAVTSASSFAGTPLINARQNVQQQRIYYGVASGEVTPGEYLKLQKGQARVQNLENKAKADGVVTPFERARIHTAQNVQSARIWIKKHN